MNIRKQLIASVAGALSLLLVGAGTGFALWSSTASSTTRVAAGAVVISDESASSFAGLAHTFSGNALNDTAPIVARNTGTVAAPYTLTLGAQTANALATGIVVRVWTVPSTAACTPATTVPSSATSSNWTNVPVQSGALAPGALTVHCIRTSVTAAQAGSLSGATMTATARLSAAVGSWISTRNWTATQQVAPDAIAPSTPGTPVANAITSSSTTLTWIASTDNVGVTGYRVFRDGQLLQTVPGTSFTDAGLDFGTTYSYAVRAVDAAGNVSAQSGALSAMTLIDTGRWFTIVDYRNNCLQSNAAPLAGQNVRVAACAGTTRQDWRFKPAGNGTYSVISSVNQTLAWEAAAVSEGILKLQSDEQQPRQTWRIEKGIDGTFVFRNVGSGECVDVYNSDFAGDPVEQYACGVVEGDEQKFRIAASGNQPPIDSIAPSTPAPTTTETSGYSTRLSWPAANDAVGVTAYRVYQGATLLSEGPALSYTATGLTPATAYTFSVRAIDAAGNLSAAGATSETTLNINSGLWYQVRNPNSGLCVNARGAGTASGTALETFACADQSQQKYQFVPTTDGYYRVMAGHVADRAWEVNASGMANQDPVSVAGYLGGLNQQWRVILLGDGSYSFAARHSQKCLVVPGAATAPGTRLTQFNCDGGIAQRWTLATITAPDTTAPTTPGTPVASATTGTATTLTWSASTDNVGVTGYRVFRNGAQVATVTGRTFTDTGLTAGTTYSYTVGAIDAAGNASPLSGARSVTTSSPPALVDPTAFYQVKSIVNGDCLQRSDAQMFTFTCYTSNTDAVWQFSPTSGGAYKVSVQGAPAIVWTVAGQSTADGASITALAWATQAGQQWKVESAGSGQFKFVNVNSARCLDANGAGFSTPQQRTCVAGNPQQLFTLVKVG